ncbi:hypothetical protein [Burkholderia cenocepacia]|uniref:Uncharacterized protein n=1 Tax=Burkholderia cenocepacia TaxID=95486 RepID=A0A1V2W3T1_9BURK|nr:hypothetical protein [Burkholderia cenocepacia]MBR8248649.1 hypothetical protein [Burkholderia cenocepacia]MBR8288823.1 hypothetical protein [Burkholderia cenocepacia]MBR8497092.1 hypothetical protein [Burkholderia cenocepacia]ONJ13665.1 hypothetical protein A8D83_11900 [Burkholderia cenocepacia]ONJ30231.1 hypothetical protein A8D90_07310 [Burkholderia cenocepacia]
MDSTNNRIYRETPAVDDGGPAFPVDDPFALEPRDVAEMKRLASGMSLRDYFAAKAMRPLTLSMKSARDEEMRSMAREAYAIADAMLRARKA